MAGIRSLTLCAADADRLGDIVGAVTAHNADGTSTIQVSGGFFRARGQSVPVGQQAETENGVVMRQTVLLPTVTIEV